jgi:sugar-specific transcriptional regulator TrmB
MEINLHTDLPQNEKTFIKNQIVELKNTLNSLTKDTSLAIENLNRLQKSIDIKQTEALAKLLHAEVNDTLNVVEINTTSQSITQSIFNTTDAILDKQACKATNGYNVLKHSNFTIEKASDTTNGIDIMSEYNRGTSLEDSQVQIFYPNLETAKEDDSIVVFQDKYYFAFDKAWKKNTNKSIYIMTPKEKAGTYSCYKFQLNFSVAPRNIKGTKVFRYQDI